MASESQLQEQISAATSYEELFVPALFRPWTPIVASAANIQPGNRVLDVACGTGILTREVASIVGPTGYTCGLDINPGMLEVAKSIAPAIDWRLGSADSLPFSNDSFDAVVSQFGLMFFPDREKFLREMLRVLVSGGRFAVAVWDLLDNIPAFAEEVALLERLVGPQVVDAMRGPFVLGNKAELIQLARNAEIAVEVRTQGSTANFPSIRSLVEADLRGWLPAVGVTLEEATIQQILEEADEVLGSYTNDQGRAVFQVSAHIICGTKP